MDISKIKLGNTTYDVKDSSARSKLSSGEIVHYLTNVSGTAGTSNSNRTQWTGTASEVSALYTGLMVMVKIPLAGVNKGVTLNVNSLGEHPVVLNASSIVTTHYPVNAILTLVYDASQKATVMVSGTNTEYTGCWKIANYDSGNTYPLAQCETAAATLAKGATCSNFTLANKSYVMVNMRYANSYDGKITLNINGTGAKDVYINGAVSSSSNKTLPAGSYLVYYEDSKFYFRTDGKITGSITGDAATVNGKTVGVNVPSTAVFTDTKNTAGSTDSSSKLFLIGATSQEANPQTYSQDTAYVGTDGHLYSGNKKVATESQISAFGSSGIIDTHGEGTRAIILDSGNDLYAFYQRGGTCTAYEVETSTTLTSATLTPTGTTVGNLSDALFNGIVGYNQNPVYSGDKLAVYDLVMPSTYSLGSTFYWSFGASTWKPEKMRILIAKDNGDYIQKYTTDSCPTYGKADISNSSTGYNKIRLVVSKYSRLSLLGIRNYDYTGQRTTFMSRVISDPVYRSVSPAKNSVWDLGTTSNYWKNLYVTNINGVAVGSSPKFTDNNTTYTFAGGTNKFTVTPSGGSALDVTVTPSISNNVTASGNFAANAIVVGNAANLVAKNSGVTISTTTPSSSSGDTTVPTSKAVWNAVANGIAANDAMVYKGTVAGGSTGNYGALTPAASKGETYKVTTAGKIDGIAVEIGDMLICNTDSTAAATSSNYSTIAANWDFIQTNIDGAVTGPTSSTSGNLASYDGATGKVIKDSGLTTTNVSDAVSKKHSHSSLTLSTTAQAYDGSHTLALPSSDPYSSARTPSSHTHGNILNGGTLLTNDITIASGDKLVVTDSSDSSKVARTSVSFDGSTTTTALTPKGTFESFSKFSGSYNDLTNKPTIPAAASNGTFSVKTKVGSNAAVTAADFTANQSSADDVTFIQGNNVTLSTDTTNRTITINATLRAITDSYTGSSTTTAVSQAGTNALYNALLNGYASSAGNADTVDSYHATKFGWVYNSSNINSSSTVTVNDLAGSGGSNATFGMINSATDNPTGAAKWVHVWSLQWGINSASSWVSQIAIGTNDKDGMWYRTNGSDSIVGAPWKRVIDSGNYSSYALPLSGGTMNSNAVIYLPHNATIKQKQINSSSYATLVHWLKNSTGWYKDDGTTLYTYLPQIGLHNIGDTYGAITILPYATDSDPWGGTVGLYISKTLLKFNNTSVSLSGHNHDDRYLPLAGGDLTGTIYTPGTDITVLVPRLNKYDNIGAQNYRFWQICGTDLYGNLEDTTATCKNLNPKTDKTYACGASGNAWISMETVSISNSTDVLNIQNTAEKNVRICCYQNQDNSTGGYVGIGKASPSYKLHVNGACGATSHPTTSDMRLKNVQQDLSMSIDDIANAPLFLFKWREGGDSLTHVGSSAQYWQEKVPELVSEANDDIKTLSLEYEVLGTASSITIAKEVVSLKEEIKLLKALIVELKQLLNK